MGQTDMEGIFGFEATKEVKKRGICWLFESSLDISILVRLLMGEILHFSREMKTENVFICMFIISPI